MTVLSGGLFPALPLSLPYIPHSRGDMFLFNQTPGHEVGLVLLAGPLFDFQIRSRRWAFIVAADGGARHALQQDLLPDHVIGDLDSLSHEDEEKLMAAGVPMTRLPTAKDKTDGEAALAWAIDQGTVDSIVIAGGLGGRFDHALGSVILLEQLSRAGLSGCVTDGRQQVYLLHDGLAVPGSPGDQLSIIPLTPAVTGFSVNGVRWPLRDATLHASSTLTISNELAGPSATFSVREGRAVVVRIPARYA